ncbi:peptidase domain-containing ABC transporter [Kordiimonas sp. SCSIO 12603]|uniref:peptidase domain-containing ABC transporter n=1 Tax=Kordiimonas sp. SCSIO 12603 TaxID=2829596 RepID=UPI00210652EC|nr:peptidase domain-containing ABC transporter [Kordiimonas sp. SCSIO 12603]UTW58837.1 peptidase domain-containing ABC transporter [Kordiimonas sp. SCSIO 12603]
MSVNFGNISKKIKPIRQSAAAECGFVCITMILNHHGRDYSLQDIRRIFGISLRGNVISDLMSAFDTLGFESSPFRVDMEDLEELVLPCILHWNFDHFVVLEKCKNNSFVILDPLIGRRELTYKEVSDQFTGVALEVEEANNQNIVFEKTKNFNLLDVLPQFNELLPLLTPLFLLTLLLNAVAISLPFFVQILLDKLLPNVSASIDVRLSTLFFALILVGFFVAFTRVGVAVELRRKVSQHISEKIFKRLIKLKLDFFEHRSSGSLATMYRSVHEITTAFSESLITSLIDGIAVLVGLFVLLSLNLELGLILFAIFSTYSIVAYKFQQGIKSRLAGVLHSEAIENAFFVESIKSVRSIRLFSAESIRLTAWKAIRFNVEEEYEKLLRYKGKSTGVLELILNGGWMLLIICAASQLVANGISVGYFVAYVAWFGFLTARIQNGFHEFAELDNLQVHVDRLSDVLGAELDESSSSNSVEYEETNFSLELGVSITCQDVCFSYADNLPSVLESVSLSTEADKFVVIKGKSGEGKSTLLKLLTGILTPDSGTVFVNGIELTQNNLRQFRKSIGVVGQNEQLLMGSISENISFFETNSDSKRIIEVAKLAEIHADIESWPMGYDTIVNEGGTGFSAGQIQRILLARALYSKPKLLILDEFSSNLDEATEAKVIDNLKMLNISILSVAHRPGIVNRADEVFSLKKGHLTRYTSNNRKIS